MATARLAHLRSGIPQPPRISGSAGTVSNKPPSEASAGGPERNRKRLPNLAARRPVGQARARTGPPMCAAHLHAPTDAAAAPGRHLLGHTLGGTTGGTGRSARPV